jgi:hypothetical protein
MMGPREDEVAIGGGQRALSACLLIVWTTAQHDLWQDEPVAPAANRHAHARCRYGFAARQANSHCACATPGTHFYDARMLVTGDPQCMPHRLASWLRGSVAQPPMQYRPRAAKRITPGSSNACSNGTP